ncbi:hypothetical protein AB6A40_004970 [Gnathostoma spinigerum]|uniref:Pepsin inhibitor-3-like repeated domain-containing protein n=1 Tax=Gnathostoma spinigerum TaxID=75299 RepID=A0ABD6EF26_9BILA
MAKQLLLLFILMLPIICRGASISTISISTNNGVSCNITNGIKYVNGVNKGPLTAEDKKELERYEKEMNEWSKGLGRSIQSTIQTSQPRFPWNENPNRFPWNPFGEGSPFRQPIFPFGYNLPGMPWGAQRNLFPWNPYGFGYPFFQSYYPFGANAIMSPGRFKKDNSGSFPSPPAFCITKR